MLVAIVLDEREQALLLVQAWQDHPAWQSIARKIERAQAEAFAEELARRPTWNQHANQLGDWCPWSGHVTDDADYCPAMCPASQPIT